jgi:hypothetical protein
MGNAVNVRNGLGEKLTISFPYFPQIYAIYDIPIPYLCAKFRSIHEL